MMMSQTKKSTSETKAKSISVTLPIAYYNILRDLKDNGIVSSIAEATRSALVEWLIGRKDVWNLIKGKHS